MCDFVDGYCDVWINRWIRARKARPCMACKEVIEVGDVYHKHEDLYDGAWQRWHHCARCWKMLVALESHLDDREIGVDPYLNCGEIWDDPPDDVVALAFMSHAEIASAAEKEAGSVI